MLGLETALPIVIKTMVETGKLDWNAVAERCSRTPARIAGLTEHGHDPAEGVAANLTLVDPAGVWTVSPGDLTGPSRNTPYAGLELPGRVVATFFNGTPTVLDGKLQEVNP